MSLLDRIANDPVAYAFRILALLVLLFIVAAVAYGQTQFPVACRDGYCTMREADLERLQAIINAMVERIQELQAKTNCT